MMYAYGYICLTLDMSRFFWGHLVYFSRNWAVSQKTASLRVKMKKKKSYKASIFVYLNLNIVKFLGVTITRNKKKSVTKN